MKKFYSFIITLTLFQYGFAQFCPTFTFNGTAPVAPTATTVGVGGKGTIQTYTVPTDVTAIRIEARGAKGGNSPITGGGTYNGGQGGRVQATFNVTPGDVLYILIGGKGGDGSLDDGINNRTASGGGGATVVSKGPIGSGTLLLVAGGGGGAGHFGGGGASNSSPGSGTGSSGAGGASFSANGSNSVFVGNCGQGGQALNAGGNGGANNCYRPETNGGGYGGGGAGDYSTVNSAGGGGGGGYVGGNAGGTAGGNGGSSFIDSTATNVLINNHSDDNGSVSIYIVAGTQLMTWNGSVSSDWNNYCNWTPKGIPTSKNQVYIPVTTNNPIISSGIIAVKHIWVDGAEANLLVNSGATLKVSTDFGDGVLGAQNGGLITNRGTINVTNTYGIAAGYRAVFIASNSTLVNYGTLNISYPQNYATTITGTLTNKNGGKIFITNSLRGFSVNPGGTIVNESNATIKIDTSNAAIFSTGILNNSGVIEGIGQIENYTPGQIINNTCGIITLKGNYWNNVSSTTTNTGFFQISDGLNAGGTFTNNGVLKYGKLSGVVINNQNNSIIVKNATMPIFTYGGTYDGIIHGIFIDSLATISAGTFILPNTFTPLGSLPLGSQTLYTKVTPSGGGCTYIVPFTYINCSANATINYLDSNYCKSVTAVEVNLLGTKGGNFSSTSGLNINSTTGEINPSNSLSGKYKITYKLTGVGGCSDVSTTTNVTIHDLPSVKNTGTNAVCVGSTITLLPNTGGTWLSSNPSIASVGDTGLVTTISNGTVKFTFTQTNTGCSNSTDTIFVNPNPNIIQSSIPPITCIRLAVDLGVSVSNGSNYIFHWTTQNGSFNGTASDTSISAIKAGEYNIKVTNGDNGCFSTAQLTVVENNIKPTVSISGVEEITCKKEIVTISAQIGQGSYTYNWSAPSGGAIVGNNKDTFLQVSSAGIYSLVVTDTINGCETTKNVDVTEKKAKPNIFVSSLGIITCTNPQSSISINVKGGTFNYFWTTANGNIVSGGDSGYLTVDKSGDYEVKVVNLDNGCFDTKVVTVTENTTKPTIQIANPAEITCKAPTVTLNANVGNGTNFEYNWTTSSGNIQSDSKLANITVNKSGTYILEVTNTVNGCKTVQIVDVLVAAKPIAKIDIVQNILCFGDQNGSIKAEAFSGKAPYTYNWSTGGSDINLINVKAGTYTLEVKDDNGCIVKSEIKLDNPPQLELSVDKILDDFSNGNGSIDVTTKGGTGILTYTWYKNGVVFAITEDISGLTEGIYKLVIKDANGCIISSSDVIIKKITEVNDITGLLNFTLFPNPTTTTSIVKVILDHTAAIKIIVYDLMGRVVNQSKISNSNNFEYEIDLTAMPNEAYIIKINIDNQTITRRLFKQ